ncbi:MAG: SPOR domain-containing protein [Pseudomonadota bacterium]
MTSKTLFVAALLFAGGTAQAADFQALRVNAPATLSRAGDSVALLPQGAVMTGDVVSAGPRGKVALQLDRQGLITLSSLGDLQVFEAKALRGKQPASAKLKLLAGALRVDSRAAKGKPAQDVRVNVGSLKTRIFNAEAWGANTAEGDTFCLLAGTVSVQTDASTEERLETPGSCLRREPDGQISRFAADTDAVIVGAISATTFEGMSPIASTLVAELEASGKVAAPAPAPAAVASAPMRSAVPAPAADASGGWTVVVLSLAKPEPVAARAQALAEQGLPASTRSATVNGVTMHRVAVGSFASQAEARAYAASTLAKSGIKGWAAPL